MAVGSGEVITAAFTRDLATAAVVSATTTASVYQAGVQVHAVLSKHDWVENLGAGTRLDIEIIEPPVTPHAAARRATAGVAQSTRCESG